MVVVVAVGAVMLVVVMVVVEVLPLDWGSFAEPQSMTLPGISSTSSYLQLQLHTSYAFLFLFFSTSLSLSYYCRKKDNGKGSEIDSRPCQTTTLLAPQIPPP